MRAKRAELGDCYDFSMSSGAMVANHVQLGGIDELLARADQEMYSRQARAPPRRPPREGVAAAFLSATGTGVPRRSLAIRTTLSRRSRDVPGPKWGMT